MNIDFFTNRRANRQPVFEGPYTETGSFTRHSPIGTPVIPISNINYVTGSMPQREMFPFDITSSINITNNQIDGQPYNGNNHQENEPWVQPPQAQIGANSNVMGTIYSPQMSDIYNDNDTREYFLNARLTQFQFPQSEHRNPSLHSSMDSWDSRRGTGRSSTMGSQIAANSNDIGLLENNSNNMEQPTEEQGIRIGVHNFMLGIDPQNSYHNSHFNLDTFRLPEPSLSLDHIFRDRLVHDRTTRAMQIEKLCKSRSDIEEIFRV